MYDSEIMDEYTYRPFCGLFEPKESRIEGRGLFLLDDDKAVELLFGSLVITHHLIDGALIRNPVGGLLNHSDTPNCRLIKTIDSRFPGEVYILDPIDGMISKGVELTLNYVDCKICGK